MRLICVEGLLGAGKTCLVKLLNETDIRCINLDAFLPTPALNTKTWLVQVLEGGAEHEIESALPKHDCLVVEGAVCWPVVKMSIARFQDTTVRRVYVKRMQLLAGRFTPKESPQPKIAAIARALKSFAATPRDLVSTAPQRLTASPPQERARDALGVPVPRTDLEHDWFYEQIKHYGVGIAPH